MEAIKKILVATDFSPTAENGLDYAMEMARILGASVVLYHAFVPFESGFYPLEKQAIENDERARDLAEGLNSLKERVQGKNRDVPLSVCVDRGTGGKRIIEYCSDKGIDLIIMGTTGASGVREVLIGSFASQVMRQAPCPVLAIPGGVQFTPPKKIIYATNYYGADFGCLRFLAMLNRQLHAEVDIVHVVDDNRTHDVKVDQVELHWKRMSDALGAEPFSFNVIHDADVPGALLQYAVDTYGDILALARARPSGVWKRFFHKSITRATMHHASIPLLAFPEKWSKVGVRPDTGSRAIRVDGINADSSQTRGMG